jgi:hypothetical protein
MGGEYHGLFHVSSAPPRPTRPHGPHHAEVAGAPLRMCRIRIRIKGVPHISPRLMRPNSGTTIRTWELV